MAFPASPSSFASSPPASASPPVPPSPLLAVPHVFQDLHHDRSRLALSPSLPNLRRNHRRPPPHQPHHPPASMLPPPTSLTIASPHSPPALQSHIYTAFLQRKTADVALHVRGTWHAIYRLHRVVLIQAGFFHSLFTSGFSESKIKPSGHRLEPDMLDIVLEDPNITRPAFEICIARLYGGGPSLFISPALIATPKYPLTPAFPTSFSYLDPPVIASCPPDQHPASPRFLLSLLATSLFLSIPSVASQALTSILKTVGPTTAVRYLNFAIGKGISEPDEEEPDAAVGLEDVAEVLKDDEEESLAESFATPVETSRPLSSEELSEKLQGLDVDFDRIAAQRKHDLDVVKEDPSDLASESESSLNASHAYTPHAHVPELSFFYGGVSDKIGEAAACWLARWGVDMLRHEQDAIAATTHSAEGGTKVTGSTTSETSTVSCTGSTRLTETKRTPSAMRKRATTIPSDEFPSCSMPSFQSPMAKTPSSSSSSSSVDSSHVQAPVIWRRGGLDGHWVRGVLSSDWLFIAGEKERYDMARAVVDIRRAEGISTEEEAEFVQLFAKGIYYANMNLDDLMDIAKDICPVTGKPYVPPTLLQSAHWDQSVLRHRITTRPLSSSSPSSPTVSTPSANNRGKDVKELGITVSSAELASYMSSHDPKFADRLDALHHPIPTDSSSCVGDSTGIEGASMDQLFEVSSPGKKTSETPGILAAPPCEANFFSLQPLQQPGRDCVPDDPSGKAKWSPYPPFRFAVEFWDVDALKEKSRLHSRTVWYAGSLWNVYVQIVRKKGVQLGVYLHRQSTVDPIPPPSAPVILPSSPISGSLLTAPSPEPSRSPNMPLHQTISIPSAHYPSRSSTPHSTPSSPAISSSLPTSYSAININTNPSGSPAIGSVAVPATAPPVVPQQPYRDPRGSVSAYFTIACASATGASLTRFTSAPDAFAVSQSWGWKSSSLRTEEYLELGEDGMPQTNFAAGKEVSFRATVVLGVV